MWPPQERSEHAAVTHGELIYVWGGCKSVAGAEVFLPSDEISIYNMISGTWESHAMDGDVPPFLSRTCGSFLEGTLYIFGGSYDNGFSNQMYCVNLLDGKYTWKRVTHHSGAPPTPRDKHSCWVHKNRLIYFGGYGCKQIRDVTNSQSFSIDETSWATIGNVVFRFWGWNNEVHVYKPDEDAWNQPQISGRPPSPRAAHASAVVGNIGYVCGGMSAMLVDSLDIHTLNLDSGVWTSISPASMVPKGRSWHSLTSVSDSAVFLFGGLSNSCEPLGDGWLYEIPTQQWQQVHHPHHNKPRICHTACLGRDGDVVVLGGCQDYVMLMDTVSIFRSPSQSHCCDVLVFQMQPYSLFRLCEDCIGRNAGRLQTQLSGLPTKLQEILQKRISFFLTTEAVHG